MVPGSTARDRWYCKNCDEAFRDLFKYKSHLTRKFDLCPAEGGTKLMCYQIVGGPSIWYPMDIAYPQASNNIATAAAAVSTVNNNNNNTPSTANPSTAGQSQAANHDNQIRGDRDREDVAVFAAGERALSPVTRHTVNNQRMHEQAADGAIFLDLEAGVDHNPEFSTRRRDTLLNSDNTGRRGDEDC